MKYRGLVDKRGEVFALFDGDRLYTLDQEVTGRVEGDYIVDLSGNRVWRLFGDGVYSLDGVEPIGFFGAAGPEDI